MNMDRWLHSQSGRLLLRASFHVALWGNVGVFLTLLAVPHKYFAVMFTLTCLFGIPGVFALSAFLMEMLLCILSSRRLALWAKVLWSLSFLPFHIVAASIYYFAIYRREAPMEELQHA
jgi:hypothetical protein